MQWMHCSVRLSSPLLVPCIIPRYTPMPAGLTWCEWRPSMHRSVLRKISWAWQLVSDARRLYCRIMLSPSPLCQCEFASRCLASCRTLRDFETADILQSKRRSAVKWTLSNATVNQKCSFNSAGQDGRQQLLVDRAEFPAEHFVTCITGNQYRHAGTVTVLPCRVQSQLQTVWSR